MKNLTHEEIWNDVLPTLKWSRNWHSKEDNEALCEIVGMLPEDAIGIEIGTAEGQSMITMLLANVELEMCCVDIEFSKNLDNNALVVPQISRLHLYETNSKKAFLDYDNYSMNRNLDLVFIDAVHTYESVKEDITMWSTRLKKGGLIALHDYHENHPGSIKAINECIVKNPDYEVLFIKGAIICAKKLNFNNN